MTGATFAGWCFLSYAVGSVSWSYLLVRHLEGVDLRDVGSGNLGATNAGRVLGRRWAVAIYLLDLLKGLSCVGLPALTFSSTVWRGVPLDVAAGLCVVLGHVFPFYLGFRGGKGVATGSGVVFAIAPLTGLGALAVWGLVVALTRIVSAASMAAAASLPLIHLATGRGSPSFAWHEGFLAAVAALVIVLHRSNIVRILEGREHKTGRSR